MEVKKICLGSFGTNTYILEIDNNVVLIDPAGKYEKFLEILNNKKLISILLTHGHFDHIKAVDGLYRLFNIPVYISKEDDELSRDKNQCLAFGLPYSPVISCPVIYLKEGMLKIGPFNFEVIFTPGHTEGSVCYKIDNYLFTGDTLFRMSVGRTDLKGGDNRKLKSSLRILSQLNPELIVCPGHDSLTTLKEELESNPYLKWKRFYLYYYLLYC